MGFFRRNKREEETTEVESPPWALHFQSLLNWHNSAAEVREGIGDPIVYTVGEQADAMVRRYLADHDLDEYLEGDEWTAYISYTVAEMMSLLFYSGINQLYMRQVLDPRKKRDRIVHDVLAATLCGGIQRLTWHAAAHVFGDEREPYGDTVGDDEMPELLVEEPERTIKESE